MQLRAYEVGPFGVNTYLLWDEQTNKAAIVDPSFGSEGILDSIRRDGLVLDYIINTHGHVDHVAGNAHFKEHATHDVLDGEETKTIAPQLLIHEAEVAGLRNAPRMALGLGMRAEQSPEPDRFVTDGERISLGESELTVIHTPGHSPGGICLYWPGNAIVGDTLFAGSIGRTDFPGGDHGLLISGVRAKLFVLPESTRIYPGHGPASTIGDEKRYNPFFAGRSSSGLWVP